jgi:two-component system, NarL family, response regulator NreC
MARIRILIADDHALFRAGLRVLLAGQPDIEVVGEAGDGVVVVDQCRRQAPDLVLMDLTMPGRGGVRAIEDLQRTCPNVKILVLTMHEDPAFAWLALRAGAAGCVLKKSLAAELLTAIRSVGRGEQYITPTVAREVLRPERTAPLPHRKGTALDMLTPREQELVGLIALGHTTLVTARLLSITVNTVEAHRRHIMTKLGLRNRAELVRFALEHGLLAA